MSEISSNINNEKIIILFLHPDDEFVKLPKEVKIFNSTNYDENFFGVDFNFD